MMYRDGRLEEVPRYSRDFGRYWCQIHGRQFQLCFLPKKSTYYIVLAGGHNSSPDTKSSNMLALALNTYTFQSHCVFHYDHSSISTTSELLGS